MNTHLGLAFAFSALLCWSIAPFFFSAAGRRIGPLATNMLRLGLAAAGLTLVLIARLLAGASPGLPQAGGVAWMIASGIIGLSIGDAFLYRAFVTVGPERTSQIQVLAPAATALLAWLALGETLTPRQIAGMALILGGVFAATTYAATMKRRRRKAAEEVVAYAADAGPVPSGNPNPAHGFGSGAWAALWSALFQGLGTMLARKAFLSEADLDPGVATLIRIGAGAAALWTFAALKGPLPKGVGSWKFPPTLWFLCIGTLFGPLAGMSFYVAALKSAPAGIVTTITFMVPLLIVPIGARVNGTPVGKAALAGTVVSLAGVILLGWL